MAFFQFRRLVPNQDVIHLQAGFKETKDNADAAADEETAADAAVKKAKESGQRVADAAKSEADKQKLGDVKS